MSKTTFNKQIRALRICRWPYRKRNSLLWLAGEMEAALVRCKPLWCLGVLEGSQGVMCGWSPRRNSLQWLAGEVEAALVRPTPLCFLGFREGLRAQCVARHHNP